MAGCPTTLAGLGQREIGVQVSVGLLGGGDLGDYAVGGFFQGRIGISGQRVRGALQHLVDIGVVEVDAAEFALHQSAGLREVVDPAGLFAPLKVVRQRFPTVGLQPRRPEPIAELHVRKRHGGKLAVRRPFRRRLAAAVKTEIATKNSLVMFEAMLSVHFTAIPSSHTRTARFPHGQNSIINQFNVAGSRPSSLHGRGDADAGSRSFSVNLPKSVFRCFCPECGTFPHPLAPVVENSN